MIDTLALLDARQVHGSRVAGAGERKTRCESHPCSAHHWARDYRTRASSEAEVVQQSARQTFVDAHRCEIAEPLVARGSEWHPPAQAVLRRRQTTPPLPDPRRLFPPVAAAGLETLPSAHDVSGLEPAPPPPAFSAPVAQEEEEEAVVVVLFVYAQAVRSSHACSVVRRRRPVRPLRDAQARRPSAGVRRHLIIRCRLRLPRERC